MQSSGPKKSKRSKTKYPALHPELNLKTRSEEIGDIDYLDKLNDEEKQWLNNFNEEEINANLKHKGKIFNKTKKDRKRIYSRNNQRNRDIYTRTKAQGKLVAITDAADGHVAVNHEDRLIAEYDLKHNRGKK